MQERLKVGAYIIRRQSNHHELLVFAHRDLPEVPLQIPGGGVDEGESVEQALWREIEEEAGLTNLVLLRGLGSNRFCWQETNEMVTRHFFLLQAPPDTPDTWEHTVYGEGIDCGMVFAYEWKRLDDSLQLAGDLGFFLTREHVPELFN